MPLINQPFTGSTCTSDTTLTYASLQKVVESLKAAGLNKPPEYLVVYPDGDVYKCTKEDLLRIAIRENAGAISWSPYVNSGDMA